MPVEIIMPKVDMDMASGTVMTWHVGEGDAIEKGAPLFDIETDKAAMEVEAEAPGFVHHRVPEGTKVDIGQPVAWLYADGEDLGAPPATNAPTSPEETSAVVTPEPQAVEVATATQKTRATPNARKSAREGGFDIDQIVGTGPRGRVQKSDVEVLLRQAPADVAPATFAPQPGSLAITRRDGAGPPLVMIHGFAADAMSWASLDRHLNGRATIRIALPCHGKSPLRQTQDLAALSRDLRKAIDDLQLDSFDLVGHSLGGALALSLADVRPRKLRSVTLLAPAGLGPEIDASVVGGLTRAARPESLAPWLKALVADENLITDAFVRLAHASRSAEMRAAQAAMAQRLFPDATQAFDVRAALSRLSIPSRIIWGRQDRVLPWQHCLAAPGSTALHLFDQMGHVPHLEAPEAVGRLLKEPL